MLPGLLEKVVEDFLNDLIRQAEHYKEAENYFVSREGVIKVQVVELEGIHIFIEDEYFTQDQVTQAIEYLASLK